MADEEDDTAKKGSETEKAADGDRSSESVEDDADGEAAADKSEERAPSDKPEKKKPSSDDADESGRKPQDKDASGAKRRIPSWFSWRWAAAGLVIATLCGVIVFGSFKYRDATRQLAQIHQDQADRDKAAQMAKDYVVKSLTYTHEDPDGFLKSVEDGVAPALKDKYLSLVDLIKGIMSQAKVESSGKVLGAEVTPQPGGSYQVMVVASQTTRNLQNPKPRVSTIVLQVVVNKIGDTWQIADIGLKNGGKLALGEQAPPGIGGPVPALPSDKPKAPIKPNAVPAVPGLH